MLFDQLIAAAFVGFRKVRAVKYEHWKMDFS